MNICHIKKKKKKYKTDLLNKLIIYNKEQKSPCLLYVEKYFGNAKEGEREKDHILMEWWWKSWWKMLQLTWNNKISIVTSFFYLSWIISKQLMLCAKTTVRAGPSWSAFVTSFRSSVQGFCIPALSTLPQSSI